MSKNTYTIVTSLIISADSPAEAYSKLLSLLPNRDDYEFETTDEWYGPDGSQLDVEDIHAAIDIVYAPSSSHEG